MPTLKKVIDKDFHDMLDAKYQALYEEKEGKYVLSFDIAGETPVVPTPTPAIVPTKDKNGEFDFENFSKSILDAVDSKLSQINRSSVDLVEKNTVEKLQGDLKRLNQSLIEKERDRLITEELLRQPLADNARTRESVMRELKEKFYLSEDGKDFGIVEKTEKDSEGNTKTVFKLKEDGSKYGLGDYLKDLRKSEPSLFAKAKGIGSGNSVDSGGSDLANPYSKGSFDIAKIKKLEAENPELAKSLLEKAVAEKSLPGENTLRGATAVSII